MLDRLLKLRREGAKPVPATGANGGTALERVARGLEHHQAGRLREADAEYGEALRLDPDNVDALHFSGVVAYQEERQEEAYRSIARALTLNPANPPAHNNLGNVLLRMGRFDEAAASFEQAIALKADYADAYTNLAALYLGRGQPERAVASCRKALLALPVPDKLRLQLAQGLGALGRFEEAIATYREAVAQQPDSSAAHAGLGYALRQMGRIDEAIASYRRAAAADAAGPAPLYDLGDLYCAVDQVDEAIACFREALTADPEFAEGRWALTMAQLPAVYESEQDTANRRHAFERELEALERWVTPSRLSASARAVGMQQPFYLAYQEQDNRALLSRYGTLCARAMADWLGGQRLSQAGSPRRSAGRIRVGVVSAHFRNHSVWNAIVKGWFRGLDPDRFALEAFHLGSVSDAETAFARSRAVEFHQGAATLRDWAQAILDRAPEILIYPEIGMDPTTVKLASMRLAPVQIASWGHPETSGLPTMDYFLSAKDMEPADAQSAYTERLVALSHLGCSYSGAATLSPGAAVPVDVPAGKPLFVCPGVPFKYAPRYDTVLVGIARALGRCRFVFFSHRSDEFSRRFQRRLEATFRREGLDFGEFGVFLPWLDRRSFLALLGAADAMLDTIGFSGFNTAMQAIQAGVPVVAMEGRYLRGKFASAILRRMELGELVAASVDGYVSIASRVGRDTAYARELRARIERRRDVLFEDETPIRELEDFLAQVAAR